MEGIEELTSPLIGSSLLNQRSKKCFVGAIDIGTNSTHLLIADVNIDLKTFSVEYTDKSATRLGEYEPENGNLSLDAIERVLETLRRFKELANSYKVHKLLIAATSAVREAPNGKDFINRIKEDLNLEVELISGAEEGRLIYLGVLSGMHFADSPHILIDIGGGSTELVLADTHDARALTSTKIGAVRLQRDFIRKGLISEERCDFLTTFIQGSLEPSVDKISKRLPASKKPIMVATSGTAMAIGALSAFKENLPKLKLQGYKVSISSIKEILQDLLKLSHDEIVKSTPLSEKRSEIIIPGVLILQTAMKMMNVDEVIISERSLREGLIVDWMLRNNILEDRFSLQGNIREHTVFHQAQRFGVDLNRSKRVASFALNLYDNCFKTLHNDDGSGRQLLWAAAMLHACGQHINLSSYHKHSSYLIRNGELLGYSQSEHLMVAAIARYHRKSLPRKRHEIWQAITNKTQRKIVYEMSILLRIAASIDQRPEPVIESLSVSSDKDKAKVKIELIPIRNNINLGLEVWNLKNVCDLIYNSLKVGVTVSTG